LQLVDQVASFLEEERVRFTAAAQALGMPTSVRRLIPVASETTEQSMQTTYEWVDESPVGDMAASLLAQELPERPAAPRVAEALLRAYDDGCRIWSPILQPSWEDEPARWVLTRLLEPLAWDYMTQLQSLDRPDQALASLLADGLLELVSSDGVTFVTALALAGIAFDEDPFVLVAGPPSSVHVLC
jgi:hypothetical protein